MFVFTYVKGAIRGFLVTTVFTLIITAALPLMYAGLAVAVAYATLIHPLRRRA